MLGVREDITIAGLSQTGRQFANDKSAMIWLQKQRNGYTSGDRDGQASPDLKVVFQEKLFVS